jgi:hypothetical protein
VSDIRAISVIFLAAVMVLIGAVFFQSYAGRINLVNAERRGCVGAIADRVQERDMALAGAIGNSAIASDPRQPQRTRDARASEAVADRLAVVSFEHRMPRWLRVTRLGKHAPEFSCDRAFPAASPLP